MVEAAPRPVWPRPLAQLDGLVPCLAEGEQGRVDEVVDGQVGELLYKVVPGHPSIARALQKSREKPIRTEYSVRIGWSVQIFCLD